MRAITVLRYIETQCRANLDAIRDPALRRKLRFVKGRTAIRRGVAPGSPPA